MASNSEKNDADLENIETNASVGVNIRVKHFGDEPENKNITFFFGL